MSRTVWLRDIDDEAYAALVLRAAEAGVSVPDLLRQALARLAAQATTEDWLERTRRQPTNTSAMDVVAAFDEIRGPWSDAGR